MAKKCAFNKQVGWIELITGPMFAGKSAELIRRLKRFEYADVKYLVFKPKVDTRSCQEIISRNGSRLSSIEVSESAQILEYLMDNDCCEQVRAIGIDEAQFFDDGIIEVCNILAENNYVVIVSGLDKNFKGEPFGAIGKLSVHAENVTKLSAVCVDCGADASFSMRTVNKKPASYNDEEILIGCAEQYVAVCRHHHKVPNRPYTNNNSKVFIDFCKDKRKNKKD
ncbi:thymidine kinase [Ureaplasma diversum]|uniref:Thymidine kinase n=2 Tax=Ureaplasma diversum TaxID=42094 RepID=A0A084EZR0_9BACT|nr:thymidine kinase [Ureaplasma diversum]AJQ45634.1 thymidine kinase [Ureaplasma diversum]KEZ23452.1 Thymidine kinase [Ureaplasma diversum NCTC 246]